MDSLNESLQKRFELVEKGKKEADNRKAEKIEQTLDRIKTKDELKQKVLNDKNINH